MRKRLKRNPAKLLVRVAYERDEDGFVVAEAPDLPGCISQGRTLAEARKNIRDAIEGWLEVERARGFPSVEISPQLVDMR